jgi:hypothetical protein
LGIFLFTTASRKALGPTQTPIQWVLGALCLEVKWPGHESDHWLLSSAKVKEWVELYLHSPNSPSWRGAQLKHRDNFTFCLYLYLLGLYILSTLFSNFLILFQWSLLGLSAVSGVYMKPTFRGPSRSPSSAISYPCSSLSMSDQVSHPYKLE